MKKEFSEEAEYVLKLVNQTHQHIFLTGKAGTGKTTLLRQIVANSHKNCVIVAPTGIAAINAGGVTIHSLFQLPFNAYLPVDFYQYSDVHFDTRRTIHRHFKVRSDKRSLINNIELLIIDEVSMLRPDVLDAMDEMLQYIRFTRKPFGGVQVLFIGDLQQLPPIIKNSEWDLLSQFYEGKYFFHAQVIRQCQPLYLELSKIYRQSDANFIDILNQLRQNQLSKELLAELNQYVDESFDIRRNDGFIVLTTHNQKADTINGEALTAINKREYTFPANIVGDFPEHLFPIDKDLRLKEGAQVMFIKNDMDFEKRYYNGKIGVIKAIDDDEIVVHFPNEKKEITVDKYEWENKKYKLNPVTNDIEEQLLGTFSQYPLRLAWAITIHKSQGLTFEKAAIDISTIFAPGQAYVALSRLTSLEGLKLLSPFNPNKLSTDKQLLEYESNKQSYIQLDERIKEYSLEYMSEKLVSTYDFSYIVRMIERLEKELFSASEGAEIYKSKAWIENLVKGVAEISEVAKKFQIFVRAFFSQKEIDWNYLLERTEKAYSYFHEHMLTLERKTLYKISEIAVQKGTKSLENILHEVENGLLTTLKQMIKTKKIVESLIKEVELDKSTCHTEEIEKIKLGLIAEISAIQKTDIRYIIQSQDRGLSKKAKKEKFTESKKSTYEQTLELWKSKKGIEEIAEFRKLTSNTILNHLIKFVPTGEVDMFDLISIEKLKEIDSKLTEDIDLKVLGDLRTKLENAYSFDELRLFRVWKENMEKGI